MEIEIEGRHKNPLLHREELNFELLDVKTIPDRKTLRTRLAAQLGVDEQLVIIENIDHTFGTSRVVGFAKKYDSMEDLLRIEPEYARKRHGISTGEKETSPKDTPSGGTETKDSPPAETKSETKPETE
ncbi:MAG: hypothetical protein Q8P05_05205 [Candidatus Diapherotrites archaeon]|nr:hypothetical protein [Candidatus Diapherotrites archaeon]MDZ4256291.1 hypothetical protein [archaeon]